MLGITQIVSCAGGQHQVDLTIMKSHKVDLEDRSHGWGTISYKVSILAQCPVLLVK